MSKYVNKGSVATTLSTLIIAGITFVNNGTLDQPARDAIRIVAPILSHGLIFVGAWLFMYKGFESIEDMRATKAREKMRKELQQDINTLTQAIQSNLLTPTAKAEKQEELSNKLSELTSIKIKAKSSQS